MNLQDVQQKLGNYELSDKEKQLIKKYRKEQKEKRQSTFEEQLQLQAVDSMINNSLFETDDIYKKQINDLIDSLKQNKFVNISNDELKNRIEINQHLFDYIKKDFINNNKKIFLHGTPGTGKSYTAEAIMNTLVKQKHATLFLNMNALQNLFYQSINDDKAKIKLNNLKDFSKKCDVLILDDLGAEATNQNNNKKEAKDSIQTILYEISNSRNNKPTLITSNYNREQLSNIYNERIISRLIPKNHCLPFEYDTFEDLR